MEKVPIRITRRGKTVGVLISPEEYENLRQVKAYIQMLNLAHELRQNLPLTITGCLNFGKQKDEERFGMLAKNSKSGLRFVLILAFIAILTFGCVSPTATIPTQSSFIPATEFPKPETANTAELTITSTRTITSTQTLVPTETLTITPSPTNTVAITSTVTLTPTTAVEETLPPEGTYWIIYKAISELDLRKINKIAKLSQEGDTWTVVDTKDKSHTIKYLSNSEGYDKFLIDGQEVHSGFETFVTIYFGEEGTNVNQNPLYASVPFIVYYPSTNSILAWGLNMRMAVPIHMFHVVDVTNVGLIFYPEDPSNFYSKENFCE